MPQDRTDARVSVLDIEDRIVLRLLKHPFQIEIERCVGLAREHHEAQHVLADLIHDFPQGYEVAGALRHANLFAAAHQAYELTEDDVKLALPLGQGRDRGLHPLYISAMVRAPDLQHERIAAA